MGDPQICVAVWGQRWDTYAGATRTSRASDASRAGRTLEREEGRETERERGREGDVSVDYTRTHSFMALFIGCQLDRV